MDDMTVKKVALAGNPNTGKSLVFSRITGTGVISANYPGTTVSVKRARFTFRAAGFELVDLPGVYSLEPFSAADKVAVSEIDNADIIINIIDATTLERNLNLTLELISRNKPIVVCLNFWDDTAHKGISIDTTALQRLLGVPVVTASALNGEGISDLVASLERARPSLAAHDPNERWKRIGQILDQSQRLSHRHHTFLERLSDFSYHPAGSILTAAAVLATTFMIVRFLGENLVTRLCGPVFTRWYDPLVRAWAARIPFDFIRDPNI